MEEAGEGQGTALISHRWRKAASSGLALEGLLSASGMLAVGPEWRDWRCYGDTQLSITAVDPDGTRKVVNDYIILAISRNLDTTGTSRGSTMQKALKLKQPGAF